MGFFGNLSQLSGGNNIGAQPGTPTGGSGNGGFMGGVGSGDNPLFRIVQMFHQLAQNKQGAGSSPAGQPGQGGFFDKGSLGQLFQNATGQNTPGGNVNASAQGGNALNPNQGRGMGFDAFTARFGR